MILFKKKNLFLKSNQKSLVFLISVVVISLLLGGCLANALSGIRLVTARAKAQRYSSGTGLKAGQIAVKKGDTVYGIARSYNIPVRSIIEKNKLKPPYILKIGQRLHLPASSFHVVQKGDTLYSISRRYNVELASLARNNDINAPYNIKEGQKLTLPGSIKAIKNSESHNQAFGGYFPTTRLTKPNINIPRPEARTSSKFARPVKGKIVSYFGPFGKGRHNDGINISAAKGTPVLAAENGVVAYSGKQLKGFGNLLLLKHDGGFMTAYAHNDTITVKRGQKVKKNEQIATVGNTGAVANPQLHFEIRKGSKALDPMLYLEH